MLGLGETEAEVMEAMDDLVNHKCDVLTLGQYLQPTKMHLNIEEFIHPDVFEKYKEAGLQKGFEYVESGALVRGLLPRRETCFIRNKSLENEKETFNII